MSTYWLDFTLDEVTSVEKYNGYQPDQAHRLVVCRLTVENTFDEEISMAQTDFFLLWEDPEREQEEDDSEPDLSEMVGTYALPCFSDSQLEDSYQLAKGEQRSGDLVFEVPTEVTYSALIFEEYYVDEESELGYSVGDHYTVWFSLEEG